MSGSLHKSNWLANGAWITLYELLVPPPINRPCFLWGTFTKLCRPTVRTTFRKFSTQPTTPETPAGSERTSARQGGTKCKPHCLEVGGCAAVNETLKTVGSIVNKMVRSVCDNWVRRA